MLAANLTSAAALMLLSTASAAPMITLNEPTATNAMNEPIVEAILDASGRGER